MYCQQVETLKTKLPAALARSTEVDKLIVSPQPPIDIMNATSLKDPRAMDLLSRVGDDISVLRDDMRHLLSHTARHTLAGGAREIVYSARCGLAAGSTQAEERVAQISAHRVSVATLDIAAEALNVPSLSALVVLTPFGAKLHGNILQQALGRIQRKHADKLAPVAVFIDDHEVGMCRGLLNQVKRVLRTWGYDYEIRQPGAEAAL